MDAQECGLPEVLGQIKYLINCIIQGVVLKVVLHGSQ